MNILSMKLSKHDHDEQLLLQLHMLALHYTRVQSVLMVNYCGDHAKYPIAINLHVWLV